MASNKKHAEHKPAAVPKKSRIRWLAGGGVLAVLVGAFLMLRPGPTSDPPVAPLASPPASPTKPMAPAGHERLVGRWLRPDGGYILEIRSAAADGTLDAGYFNPNPIRVARAEWASKDGKLNVFVELRDVNYPGSTYALEFLDTEDRLIGTYFQAVQQVNFDVEFVREK